jgi:peptidoglycan hydrolase-like protein with peptidoglycan-binding domain
MTIWRGLAVLMLVGGWLETSVAATAVRPSHPTPPIVALQVGLRVLGYNPGPIDGYWGHRTRAALAAYGQDRGIVLNQATLTLVLTLLHLETVEDLRSAEGKAIDEEALPGSSPRMLPIGRW